jgi:hypothetical protein
LPNDSGEFSINVYRGIPIVVSTPEVFELNINSKEDEGPLHFLEGIDSLVVSDKFLGALRQAGVDNFEVWSAILRDPKTNREWENYYLFSEIGLLDAVLLEESDHDALLGGSGGGIPPLIGFHEIVFDAKKTNGKKMFRIPQCEIDLYMSRDVVRVLIELEPPETWGMGFDRIELH